MVVPDEVLKCEEIDAIVSDSVTLLNAIWVLTNDEVVEDLVYMVREMVQRVPSLLDDIMKREGDTP